MSADECHEPCLGELLAVVDFMLVLLLHSLATTLLQIAETYETIFFLYGIVFA